MAEETGSGASDSSVSHALRRRGMRGIIPAMADRGQIIELLCEMPKCYCPKGRGHFVDAANPMPKWAPNVDHSPVPKWKGGTLRADNVRLAHVECNSRD